MAVEGKDLLTIINRALDENGIKAENAQITYRSKRDNVWRVNISYDKAGRPEIASLLIDAESGEVTHFRQGYRWVPKQ